MASVDVAIIGSNLPGYAIAKLVSPHLRTLMIKTSGEELSEALRPINHHSHAKMVSKIGKDSAAEVVNFAHANLEHLLSILGPAGLAQTSVESYGDMVEDYCEFVKNRSIASTVKRSTEILFGDHAKREYGKPGAVRFRSTRITTGELQERFRTESLANGLVEVDGVISVENMGGSWKLQTAQGTVYTEKLIFSSDHHAAEFWSVLKMKNESVEFTFTNEKLSSFNRGLLQKLADSQLPLVAQLSNTVYLNVNYDTTTMLSCLLASFEMVKAILFGSKMRVPVAFNLHEEPSLMARL
ncbi:unnamed protein product [Kuraishia capsulata CBS 1993]|uniref:Uncharacterized protein n=1 Tax=Kuraishia capsulata CBS 1993 TaxID=1382522 RepID=W6MPI6_9ASCO|nr:uncharacterized protein KUCA_T00004603001 [Kuraishia capsulata CBS 1993]CDK28619.1 unnamed protein product [Kuraishia capsulata CBS 1993]